ncbi:MAG TPA: collagenase-like protease [Lentisphaeria bacterium]|nr:MAG: collagenase [Lentisphaerae bacterium GWF2_38_69]HBM17197.1 collagenase-like protease [Lentisphaeria bacterium]
MQIELLSPVGSYESLNAAIRAGADSIYFGAGELNMRSRSSFNFLEEDIFKVASICSKMKVKSYLALNTIIYDEEIPKAENLLASAKNAGISAVIASDLSVIIAAHAKGLPVHISVQANVSNIETLRFYSKYADVMVLARELSLDQIKQIVNKIKTDDIRGPSGDLIKIEIFAHGALCVSVSGKCYMSLSTHNASANRGACYQNCRRAYRVIDEISGQELVIDNKYVMSPKDICLIRCLYKIISAGVSVLKIEGRGRSTDYVHTVTKVYKEALLAIEEDQYTSERISVWEKQLSGVFNRGFWHGGYYLGNSLEMWSGNPENKAEKRKIRAGVVTNYFAKIGIAEINLREFDLEDGDEVIFIGASTVTVPENIKSIRLDDREVKSAPKGSIISIKVSQKVRRNDAVFVLKKD